MVTRFRKLSLVALILFVGAKAEAGAVYICKDKWPKDSSQYVYVVDAKRIYKETFEKGDVSIEELTLVSVEDTYCLACFNINFKDHKARYTLTVRAKRRDIDARLSTTTDQGEAKVLIPDMFCVVGFQ